MPIEVNRSERNNHPAQERLFLHDSELDYGAALLMAAEKRLAAASTAAMQEAGLSRGELDLLLAIRAEPGIQVSQLRSHLGMTVPTLARLLGQLDKREAVIKKRAGPDARTRALTLSAEGEALCAPIATALRAALRPVYRAAGAHNVGGMRMVLEKLVERAGG